MEFDLNTVLTILAVFLALWVFFPKFRSGYAEITTNLGDLVPDIFSNPTNLSCVPGPGKDADYYTTEASKGLCQGGNYVHKLGHQYTITD